MARAVVGGLARAVVGGLARAVVGGLARGVVGGLARGVVGGHSGARGGVVGGHSGSGVGEHGGVHGANFTEYKEKQAHMFDGAWKLEPNLYVMALGTKDSGEVRKLLITDTNARVEVGCKLGYNQRLETISYHTRSQISFLLNVAGNLWCGKDVEEIEWQLLGSTKLMVRFCVIPQALQTHPQTGPAHFVRER